MKILNLLKLWYIKYYLKHHGWCLKNNLWTNPCFLNKGVNGSNNYTLYSAYILQKARNKIRKVREMKRTVPVYPSNSVTKIGNIYYAEYYGSFMDDDHN